MIETTVNSVQGNEINLKDHIETYITESDRSAETLRVYRTALLKFSAWVEGMSITTPVVRVYKAYLLNLGLEPNTVSVYLAAVKQYLSFLVEKGILPFNTAREVRRPRLPKTHQRDALTATAARQLLDMIPTDTIRGCRDYAMVNVMLRTGIRGIEISRAQISDISEKEGQRILNIHGKGRDSKDSFVILTEEAYNPIAAYLGLRKEACPSEALFQSVGNRSQNHISTRAIRSVISDYMLKAGLKTSRVTPHSLRHTAITLAITGGNGQNLLQVQQMARHANIATTLDYFHEFERMKNAAERCIKI